jgi:hypothetical protein
MSTPDAAAAVNQLGLHGHGLCSLRKYARARVCQYVHHGNPKPAR